MLKNLMKISNNETKKKWNKNHINYKENILHIVNKVYNIELKEIAIKQKLKNLFGNEFFCYITKY